MLLLNGEPRGCFKAERSAWASWARFLTALLRALSVAAV
jgi:hypothetical protein